MSDLFQSDPDPSPKAQAMRPLADRVRPSELKDVIGQQHLLGHEGSLRLMLDAGALSSLIFWGPPGVGKTTLARLLARETDFHFEQISAIFSGVAELRKTFDAAKLRRKAGQGTLLFVDEIHRFNKAQQDSFLPLMEDGTILLVGATTENPSFEINSAVLSRAQVLTLNRLSEDDLRALLARAERELARDLALPEETQAALIAMADGDGRAMLNLIEQVAAWPDHAGVSAATLSARLQRRAAQYDKSGDGHYNLISALHKSIRGSDPDAALYWFSRMLEGGEDPRFLARRLTRMAVEDIARAFNVPPHLLALPGTNSYASVEQTNLAWVTHGLRPIIQKIEGAISPLLSRSPNGEGAYIKFNLDGLLRADIQSRMSAYSTGLQSGFLTINDVRKLEELAPMDDPSADVVRVPLANVNLDEAGVKAQRERILMVQSLVLSGYDPASVLAALDLPEIPHTGLPSSQLQPISQIDPEDPQAAYEVN